jgi:sugar phosphate isomerase/epimerase
MYSLREQIAKDGLDKVLSAVKAAGFDCVETAGFYGMTYPDFGAAVAKHGLYVSGSHTGVAELLTNPGGVLEMTDVLDFRDVIIPGIDPAEYKRDLKAVTDKIGRAADLCRKNGLRLAYHNHAAEFDGADYLQAFMDGVKGLLIEPDIFWLAVAGVEPLPYITKRVDRVMAVHLKELSVKGEDDFSPVLGDGVSDTQNVLRFAVKSGIPYVVLEFEKFVGDYGAFLQKNANYIKKIIKES